MSTQTRTITVFSTKGKRKSKIETEVTTWGELKKLVSKEGYNLDKLLATENITRRDLANEGATLPEGNFTLFLRPTKTKSGGKDYSNMSFKELRAELTDEDKTAISEETGKNYTRCSGGDIREYLNEKADSGKSFGRKSEAVEEKVEKKKKAKPSVADVVESVKKSKSHEPITKEVIIAKLADANALLADARAILASAGSMVEELQVGESEEDKAKREAEEQAKIDAKAEKKRLKEEEKAKKQQEKDDKAAEKQRIKDEKDKEEEAEAQENEDLDDEFGDMMSGF